MCGILGFVGSRSFDAKVFGQALDVMAHRGPDDRGIFEGPEVILGHRRLAILDLSPAGHQPMTSRDGRYVAVYNGEVYNFKAIRRQLEKEGAAFHTATDTEILIEHYARKGPDCVREWHGMFAMAIWDTLDESLFLARDHLGIKPLYVWKRGPSLAFASEVKALRALPGGPRRVRPGAVAAFLAWGSVPEPMTIIDEVEELPAGHWGLWKGGRGLKTVPFWTFPEPREEIRSRGEAIEVLSAILREAVALRCISDAPLGAFLSGGVDSSAVVSLMRAAGQRDLRTFSISFPQTAWDESRYSLRVAERFETRHTDVPVTERMVREELDGFFAAMDQPTCDGVNTYLVSKFARQGGLTVSLVGLGGDELFAGYGSYARIAKAASIAQRLPRLAARAGGWAARVIGARLSKLEALHLLANHRRTTRQDEALDALYFASRGLFMPSQILLLLARDWREGLGPTWSPLDHFTDREPSGLFPSHAASCRAHAGQDAFFSIAEREMALYMRNQLLRDSDVFGMAHSLEIRVPLVDQGIVETLFRINPVLIQRPPAKSLFLEALPEPLPRECTHRPKMGFTFPFDVWMRGPWRKWFQERLLDGRAKGGLFQPRALERLWKSYQDGKVHWSRPWSCLVLQHAAH